RQSAAVQLFLERARAARPAFHLTAANAPAIAAICQRLDGLPLALELAAPRLKLLTPQALLRRLDRRLPLLTAGATDLSPRHQTLRSAIAWSYDLLTAEEQRLFRGLAVFVGGCTLEAVAAACGDSDSVPQSEPSSAAQAAVLERLSGLVDQSLLLHEEQEDG